jgi:shikimate dehydrogenase
MKEVLSTRRAGVVGYPIKHSWSPTIHRYWLQKYKIDGAYDLYPVTQEDFPTFLATLSEKGLVGVNLTLPHKVMAYDLLQKKDVMADMAEAVNVVSVSLDGELRGHNTDIDGFRLNIEAQYPAFSCGPAYVIGAGGAARAVIAALHHMGIKDILLTNRTEEKSQILAKKMAMKGAACRLMPWAKRHDPLPHIGLLVNTTSQGMKGEAPLEISLKTLARNALVYDIVYTPQKTPLIIEAEAGGHATLGGLGMLLHQARPAFATWFGVDPVVDDALFRHVVERHEAEVSS